jgi:hypothetical protein
MGQRRRFKQSLTLGDRLSAFIHAMRERAELVGPGPERDEILTKVKKAETAVELDAPSIRASLSRRRDSPGRNRGAKPIFRNERVRRALTFITARPLAIIGDENAWFLRSRPTREHILCQCSIRLLVSRW